ncbi:MAG: hypothetical protein H7336_08015 [Bacteriovorax sp.]|nr:hypothetical protein [Bacteriovorax sp.]
MEKIKVIIVCIIAIFSQVVFSSESQNKNSTESLLNEIRETISNLNRTLNYTTIEVKPRTLIEAELDDFNQQIAFTSAHDPIDEIKLIPADLNSKNLTMKLNEKFIKIEKLALNSQVLSRSTEWLSYQDQIKEYLRLRSLTLYRASRYTLKDGTYELKFKNLKYFVNKNMQSSISQDLFLVKNVNMELALNQLKNINSRLTLGTSTISNPYNEAKVYTIIFFILGLLSFIGTFINYKRNIELPKEMINQTDNKPIEQEKLEVQKDSNMLSEVFYYSAWIRKFEESINSLNNELYKEEYQKGIIHNAISVLGEARVGLQLANNQQDYELNLSKLNDCAATIEDFFSEKNDESQKHFNNIILLALKLSNTIETNKTIINENIKNDENDQVETNSSISHAA